MENSQIETEYDNILKSQLHQAIQQLIQAYLRLKHSESYYSCTTYEPGQITIRFKHEPITARRYYSSSYEH